MEGPFTVCLISSVAHKYENKDIGNIRAPSINSEKIYIMLTSMMMMMIHEFPPKS